MIINIAGKEDKFELLNSDSPIHLTIKHLGLSKNLSLISIFTVSHINHSKYIGTSSVDSFQYMLIRLLPILLVILTVVRSDFVGNLKHHFEQMLFGGVYLSYFLTKDCKNSRRNQLQKFFDNELNDSDNRDYKKEYAQNREARMVLIMYRPAGNGGI